jgi:pyruvate dehydrogenase (quinone)
MEYYPEPGRATAVQIDADPSRIGLRYPVRLGLAGDAKATLEELVPRLDRRKDRSFLQTAQKRMKDWNALMDDRGTRDDAPLKPQVVAHELSALLADDAIISTDSGTVTAWAARHIRLRRGQQFSCSGNLASMACGVPYAIAAQLAYPTRQCVAFVGDGGFAMLMGDLLTTVQEKLPIKIAIFDNGSLGFVELEQKVEGLLDAYTDLVNPDFARVAEAAGIWGRRVEKPEDLDAAVQQWLAEPGPALLDVLTDRYELVMPPKVEASQVFGMSLYGAKAVLGGKAKDVFGLIKENLLN